MTRAMNQATVEISVGLVHDGRFEELEEIDVATRIAAGDTASLRDADSLDGLLRIGGAEIADTLFSAVQRLCFDGAAALLVDGAVVEYRYFSSNEKARLVACGDAVALSGSDVPESTFPRRELCRALYECGVRFLAMLDQIGRAPDANHLRPFAAAAQSALAAAGLA
jgi:hypothetical protein